MVMMIHSLVMVVRIYLFVSIDIGTALHCTSHEQHKQFYFTDNSQHPPAQAHRSQTWRCRRESVFHLHDEDVPLHDEDVHLHEADVHLNI